MTLPILALLLLLAVALVLFWFEWIPPDVTALGVLLALIALGLVPADEAFSGFGSDTFMLLFGLLVMTAALLRTGVVDVVGQRLLTLTHSRPALLLPTIMGAVALLSSVVSNTASAALFLPVVLAVGRRTGIGASRLLMPMAFAAILSSSVTLISTSTNVVVSGLMVQSGLDPIGMFELTAVGVPIVVVGLVYITVLGPRLIPDRPVDESLADRFELRSYLAEVHVLADSPLDGSTLDQAGLGRDFDLTALQVLHADGQVDTATADRRLRAGDRLLVEGSSDAIVRVRNIPGLDIQADVRFGGPDMAGGDAGGGLGLAEVVLLPGSPFLGRHPRGLRLRERHGIQLLAISRHGEVLHTRMADTRLQLGDVLLVQGDESRIASLRGDRAFDVLGVVEPQTLHRRHAWLVGSVFLGTVVLGTTGVLPLAAAMLLGAVVVFATGVITPDVAYREIDWRILVLIGSMLGLGVAMQHTGTAVYLAELLVALVGDLHPVWLLSAFFVLTVVLTQPMSNQAAAAVVIPVALEAAAQLDLNPRTFAMMIAIAASTSYLTPLEPACLMVYGPGRYQFADFLRVGGLLTVCIYAVAIVLTPMLWPL